MIYSTILAAALANSAPAMPVPDQSKAFVELCTMGTELSKQIKNDMPKFTKLISDAIEFKELTNSNELIEQAIRLYGDARESEGKVKATRELFCQATDKK